MSVQNDIANLQTPARDYLQNLYDAWAENMSVDGCTLARINVLEILYLEFPEMGNQIPDSMEIDTIREILEKKRQEREDDEDDERFLADLEFRLSINEELASRGSELHLHFDIDYASRERNFEAFGNLLEHLSDPDTPTLSGK